MANSNDLLDYKMPLTLEEHFVNLKNRYPQVEELYNLWGLLKKRMVEELSNSRCVFATYSFHDESHSRTIIQIIEKFLGDVRISQLSATDTFMLLACAYAHDYGMSQSISRIYEILGSDDFQCFLTEVNDRLYTLEKEDAWAVSNLMKQMNDEKEKVPLKDLYYSIVLVVQSYLRPFHWKGVVNIENDFKGLFYGHLKGRFIGGFEGLSSICMCHGQDMKSIFNLEQRANGIIGDEFHPRFVAAMLRLGDLLDLDNNRFPMWFVREVQKKDNIIPTMSKMNFWKHEAISHFLVTPKKIEITAECYTEHEGYGVASLISDWTGWLVTECKELVLHWSDIAQPDFGRPPGNLNIKIFVDGYPYLSENKVLQMRMSQEKVMDLLEGTNIYRDRYVGIREMLQNAVDASLLQLWKDILQNRYTSYGLSKDTVTSEMDILEFLEEDRATIFGNYDIKVEVIKDIKNKRVYVIVKDRGIGISLGDIQYISELGTSKEKNVHIKNIMDKMPVWLKPSGVFGIGLQSVFQLTDCIDFYTRQPNTPEQQISLYSYGKSKGKIEVREVPPNSDGIYYDNAVPGTNVKIVVEPQKLIGDNKENNLLYYDLDFDIDKDIDVIFAEISQACIDKIKETPNDYFNVYFQTMQCEGEDDKNPDKNNQKRLRKSYFYINTNKKNEKGEFGAGIHTLLKQHSLNDKMMPYSFIDNKAYFWDKTSNRFYTWTLRPCKIEKRNAEDKEIQQVFLPETVPNLYNVSYKFNKIIHVETIYSQYNRAKHFHAGFLNLEILILDDNPTKYLNIDRERLKEGAIDEEDILKVRGEILKKWCEYFCKIGKSRKEKRGIDNRFNSNPGMLLSLMLLFYQNVPYENFKNFKDIYQNTVDLNDIVLGDDEIPVHFLWDGDKDFQTKINIGINLEADILTQQGENSQLVEINNNTVRHLPHRLINIKSINYDKESILTYKFSVRRTDEVELIEMGDSARLWDYLGVFDGYTYPEFKGGVDYHSIQKKVFKPNLKFKNLVLSQYPHTFHKGRNFASAIDYCIQGYILSPFDQEAADILRLSIRDKKSSISEFINHVMKESEQFKKCVQYILRCRFNGDVKKENSIKSEYEEFVADFYNLVFNNRETLNNLFADKKI